MSNHKFSQLLCLPEFLSHQEITFSVFGDNRRSNLMLTSKFIENQIICSICQNICNNPCCPDSCSHIFCKKCLYSWKNIKRVCPNCRRKFNKINKYK